MHTISFARIPATPRDPVLSADLFNGGVLGRGVCGFW
jgi:hypothetical protein